jgi:hypothetical protein
MALLAPARLAQRHPELEGLNHKKAVPRSRIRGGIEYDGRDTAERGKHMTNTVTAAQFEFLRSIDTPTVCNLLEVVAPERRGFGYTVRHLHCPFPDLPPMVGFAKTVTMRAQDRVPLGEAGYMNKRLDYLDYVAADPQPSISVI